MAITTLAGALAGQRLPAILVKTGTISANSLGGRGGTGWYASSNPVSTTANTAGINGRAVTDALGLPGLPRQDPASGFAYISRVSGQFTPVSAVNGAYSVWLIDRLWENSGLSVTATTLQSITPVALPTRSIDGTANGDGVLAALEWSTAPGTGTPTATLTYTNQAGTTGRTAVMSTSGGSTGLFEVFPLAAGDTGVRAPTGVQFSATRTSGAVHLVLFRVLACLELVPGAQGGIDPITGGFQKVPNGAVIQSVSLISSSSSTLTNVALTYIEAHG